MLYRVTYHRFISAAILINSAWIPAIIYSVTKVVHV